MMTTRRLTRFAAFVFFAAIALGAMADDDKQSRILGNWLTESKDGIIQISSSSGRHLRRPYRGRQPARALG